MKASRFLTHVLFYGSLLGLWEAVCWFRIWPPYLFPSPVEVVRALVSGFQNRSFLFGIGASISRIIVGYSISLVIGFTLGLLASRFKPFEDTLGSLVGKFQVLPSICWLPLAIVWFGLNDTAIQFVVVMGALPAILIATDNGIRNIAPVYVKAAHTMGVHGLDLYRRVVFPAALPSIVTGMKMAWAFAWRSLMAGELIFVSTGLGYLLEMGRELNDMAQVMAVMGVIVLVGILFDQLFGLFEHRLHARWGTA